MQEEDLHGSDSWTVVMDGMVLMGLDVQPLSSSDGLLLY